MRGNLSTLGINLSLNCSVFECVVDVHLDQLVPIATNTSHDGSFLQLQSILSMLISQNMPVAMLSTSLNRHVLPKLLGGADIQEKNCSVNAKCN